MQVRIGVTELVQFRFELLVHRGKLLVDRLEFLAAGFQLLLASSSIETRAARLLKNEDILHNAVRQIVARVGMANEAACAVIEVGIRLLNAFKIVKLSGEVRNC